MRVAVLHAYSRRNRGDGLLVDETVSLIRDAFGPGATIQLFAAYAREFEGDGDVATAVCTRPTTARSVFQYLRALHDLREVDLIIGIGGGYLRAGSCFESLKTGVVHGPQLRRAGRVRAPSIYLPQSIGPFRGVIGRVLRRNLVPIDAVLLRDDRSVVDADPAISGVARAPDLAILSMVRDPRGELQAEPVVLSVRSVRGLLPRELHQLALDLAPFEVYVQSAVSGNNDELATAAIGGVRTLAFDELLGEGRTTRRVVVAVRLHAALMALAAGHYVIHLAYERKGFGAFDDLGLSAFVHNFFDFDRGEVLRQVDTLRGSDEARSAYDRAVEDGLNRATAMRSSLVELLRTSVRDRNSNGAR